jgi:hypothetical protein
LDADEIELIEEQPDEEVDLDVLVRWTGTVSILAEFGIVSLRGKRIGRNAIEAEGTAALALEATMTVELSLGGERFQALVHVDSSECREGRWVSRLRIGATSPRGNDLISTQVQRGQIALASRRALRAA